MVQHRPPSLSTAVYLRVPFCLQQSSLFLSMTDFLPQITKCTHMLMTQHYIPPWIFPPAPSSITRSTSCFITATSLNSDLGKISQWGKCNQVKFNTSKTQLLLISLSKTPLNSPISFESSTIPPCDTINIPGITRTSNLSWNPHSTRIAKSVWKKFGVLFRCRNSSPLNSCSNYIKDWFILV